MKCKNIIFKIVISFITILVVSASIILPDILLRNETDSYVSVVTKAPEEYYLASATAIAIDASSKLSATDRINLISGTWESTFEECSTSEGFLTESEAVTLAKKQLEIYYDKLVYPCSLESSYKNWYSYEAKLYSYTDATFNTYTAYLWELKFTKYDNTLVHTILMTESGTILNAEINQTDFEPTFKPKYISYAYNEDTVKKFFNTSSATIDTQKQYTSLSGLNINYPSVEVLPENIDMAFLITVSETRDLSENYIIYRYSTDTSYGIGIMPEQ